MVIWSYRRRHRVINGLVAVGLNCEVERRNALFDVVNLDRHHLGDAAEEADRRHVDAVVACRRPRVTYRTIGRYKRHRRPGTHSQQPDSTYSS